MEEETKQVLAVILLFAVTVAFQPRHGEVQIASRIAASVALLDTPLKWLLSFPFF